MLYVLSKKKYGVRTENIAESAFYVIAIIHYLLQPDPAAELPALC